MATNADVFESLKYRVEVNAAGTRRYYNAAGQLHREDGPAIVFSSGSREWYRNGLQHREDGPATVWSDGGKEWYINGQLHREDGPAIVHANGAQEWWINGTEYNSAEDFYSTLVKTKVHT